MKSWLFCAALMVVSSLSLSSVEAAQYQARGGQVVHSRMAPVLMHRLLPPFRGQHVYRGGRR